MERRFFAVACCAGYLVGALACAAVPLTGIPLKWTPDKSLTELGPIDVSGPLVTLKIQVETFIDTRENPALIAENREQAKPRPVTTSDSVAGFITDHLREAFQTAGFSTVDQRAAVTVSGEIRRFFVTETDKYRGQVSLLIHLKNAAGTELWTGVINGADENFGRSYRAYNYYETISDMLMDASHNLLVDRGFHDALLKAAGPGT